MFPRLKLNWYWNPGLAAKDITDFDILLHTVDEKLDLLQICYANLRKQTENVGQRRWGPPFAPSFIIH